PPFSNGSSEGGGAFVATGDTTGDGRAEIITGIDAYCCTQVHVLDGLTGSDIAGFYPFGPSSQSGARVAAGDLNGDGRADVIVAAQAGEGTEVKAFDVASGKQLASFFVLEPGVVPGASLAAGDLDGDGKAEIVLGGGPTQTPWPPIVNGPDQRVA